MDYFGVLLEVFNKWSNKMSVRKEIVTYSVYHWAKRNHRSLRAAIRLFDEVDARTDFASLEFHSNNIELPENTSSIINYHLEEFPFIIETLRTEKPVKYFFGTSSHCGVHTGQEVTGEEETQKKTSNTLSRIGSFFNRD